MMDKRKMELLIFMGQSNMAGRGITCERFPQGAPELIPGAGWEYRAITAPDRLYPIAEPFGEKENLGGGIHDGVLKTGSMVTSLVNSYYQHNGNVPVLAVSAAKGGSAAREWQVDAPERYVQDAVNRLKMCREYAAAHDIEIIHSYMVWCQGETDADWKTPKEDYFRMIRALFDIMRENGIEKIFTVSIGKFNDPEDMDRYEDMILWQKEFAEIHPDVVMVDDSFVGMRERGLMKDEYHYYQQAYNEAGEAAGKAMAEVLR